MTNWELEQWQKAIEAQESRCPVFLRAKNPFAQSDRLLEALKIQKEDKKQYKRILKT